MEDDEQGPRGRADTDRNKPYLGSGREILGRLRKSVAQIPAVAQRGGRIRPATLTQSSHSSWYRRGTVYEATRTTLDKQVDWLHEIDDKAMRTLRFNVLLLGLLVPGYSLAVRYGLASRLTDFYSFDTAMGTGCLILSVALAGVTYTASSIDVGVSADDVLRARRAGIPDRRAFDALVTSHAKWIRANRRVILWNSLLVTATVLLMIYGVVFLSLGIASAIAGTVPTTIRRLAYATLLAITVASRLL